MSLDYPLNPTVGQTYELTGRRWVWDGFVWNLLTTGTLGATGATGPMPNFILETASVLTGATGTVAHDYTANGIWLHTNIAANFVANFTNVPTNNGGVVSFSLILLQGQTAYTVSDVQVNGAAQTIKWAENIVPSPNSNKTDVVSFNLIRNAGNWIVLGALSTYG